MDADALNSLDRYLFRQCFAPFLVAATVVTSIVWMTQSLQRADILVEHGQGVGVFMRLSVLIIPSLLAVVIPFSLFAGALYALQRLHSDSEVAVMFASGVSRLRIAAPLLFISTAAAAATLWVNLDLMPASYRVLKREVAEIRADFVSAVLRSGEFVTVADGFTVYVEDASPGGQLLGLLVNDYRNGTSPETYMAQRGLLRETDAGPVLHLLNGNIQRVARYTNQIDIVRFEETVLNLSAFNRSAGDLQLELTERYLSELFHPDLGKPWDRDNASLLIAEGHNRLASPLYVFAFALIAIVALIGGAYSRRSYALRIAIACAAAGALRVLGIVVQGLTVDTGLYWAQYAVPIAAILALLWRLVAERHRPALEPKSVAGAA